MHTEPPSLRNHQNRPPKTFFDARKMFPGEPGLTVFMAQDFFGAQFFFCITSRQKAIVVKTMAEPFHRATNLDRPATFFETLHV